MKHKKKRYYPCFYSSFTLLLCCFLLLVCLFDSLIQSLISNIFDLFYSLLLILLFDQLYELQEQTNQYARDLRNVASSLSLCQRDIRSTQVTSQQINTYDEETTNLYRAIGKTFLLSSKSQINEFLNNENERLNKTQKDLEGRKEYLERRITNNKSNIADITAGTTI